jgi:hypothetical protein
MPPSYGSQEYWNNRFTSEIEPFEWLGAPHVLDPFLHDALSNSKEEEPKLLHIGCGTSMLSFHLRTITKSPDQIHNVDYSDVAIELGRRSEKESDKNDRFEDIHTANGAINTSMRWDAVDLLDHKSALTIFKPQAYSIILDKSTSDCIACVDDVRLPLPYPIDIPSDTPLDLSMRETPEPVHPLHVLAVHLAYVSKPGARWIALSYSGDRFPFVDGLYSSRPHVAGFPDTGMLWKLISKEELESKEKQGEVFNAGGTVTYKPKVSHWVYILQRTEVMLAIRGGHL